MVIDEPDEETVFVVARKISDPQERLAYVQNACGTQEAKARRVHSLLKIDSEDRHFLEQPVASSELTQVLLSSCEMRDSLIGPYRLKEQLGSGGMGVVWLAEQEVPVRRRVALKLMRTDFSDAKFRHLFEAERQALAVLDHPGIAKLLDAGSTADGRLWFVMELVQGSPITEYCRLHSLPLNDRLRLVISVCDAIHHSHQKGLIHRDLKPANILVADNSDRREVKVIDFGVAKTHEDDIAESPLLSEDNHVVGTIAYMSPEQTTPDVNPVDFRCDIYALGVLLYQLLSGSAPFENPVWRQASISEKQRMIREELPPRPSQRLLRKKRDPSQSRDSNSDLQADEAACPNCPPGLKSNDVAGDLDCIVAKAMHQNPERRYATAAAMATDISRYLSLQPVEARNGSWTYRLRKLVLRKRLPLTVTALTMMLCFFVVAISVNLIQHTGENKRQNLVLQKQQQELLQHGEALRQHSYVTQMQTAHAAWMRGDLQEARAAYEKVASADSAPGGHTFEVNYVRNLCETGIRILREHEGKVFDVTFSPDSRLLVSCSGDKSCRLVIQDVESGKVLGRLDDFPSDVNAACFSQDGRLLITSEEAKLVRIWDTASKTIQRVLKSDAIEAWSVDVSPDGQHFAVGFQDGTVSLDHCSGFDDGLSRLIRTEYRLNGCALSSTGEFGAVISDDGETVSIIDGREGRVLRTIEAPDGKKFGNVLFSGESDAVWITDHSGGVWRSESKSNRLDFFDSSYDVALICPVISQNEKLIALCPVLFEGRAGSVRDLESGREILGLPDPEVGDSRKLQHVVAFLSNNRALTLQGRSASVVDLENGRQIGAAFQRNQQWIALCAALPGQSLVLISLFDGGVLLWNAEQNRVEATLHGHQEIVSAAAVSSDKKTLATASRTGEVWLWHLPGFQPLFELKGATGHVYQMSFSSDGQRLLAIADRADGGGEVLMWDASNRVP